MQLSLFEWTITLVGAAWTVLLAFNTLAQRNAKLRDDALNKRIDDLQNIQIRELQGIVGRHSSDINNVKLDVREIQTDMRNHSDKMEEFRLVLLRIEEKIDKFRDRRVQ